MNAEIIERFTAMASPITIRVVEPAEHARRAVDEARDIIEDVATACSRFDASSPLSRANSHPDAWHIVPATCRDAIAAAYEAYRMTGGRFDPRVLRALEKAGYAASRDFSELPEIAIDAPQTVPARNLVDWKPEFRGREVRIGSEPIDLGGIGKGLAIRWAAQALEGAGAGFLVDAGGDLYARGVSPDGGAWRIGVEDPWNAEADPLVVLDATNCAVATSSIRLRSWNNAGRVRHHLIDPRTGESGGAGLVSVTVIGSDPAEAEIWSKTLFLEGAAGIERAAVAHGIPAIWVDIHGAVRMTEDAATFSIWQVAHAHL